MSQCVSHGLESEPKNFISSTRARMVHLVGRGAAQTLRQTARNFDPTAMTAPTPIP